VNKARVLPTARPRKAAADLQCRTADAKGFITVVGTKPLFNSSYFPPNFIMQKEDSLSHQNVNKCMEY
jgi:hypothetical protein